MKKRWWHEKVAYQIYPKSFCDSNGDGIGDLRGIINKLDYLKELGVDIVWLSPVYQSPFVDQGYDISDYYAIDPVFGTMDDMDELLNEAKKRDMYIVMDLVVNHCSDKHEWFQKAMEDPYGKYGKYFYIREGKDGKVPCNWRSYFGGSVWEPLPGHKNLYYLHMFAKEQPDLNWENPEVREDIYKMIRWWLDKGLAGFRLDAIINIKKDANFPDFPADREDGLCFGGMAIEQAEGVHEFLQEMKREAFAPYEAFTIGELFNFKEDEMEKYIGEKGCFESIFDFGPHLAGENGTGWFDSKPITPNEYRDTVFQSKEKSQKIGLMANIIENHDEPRGVSYFLPDGEVNEMSKKMLAGLMMMAIGLPFLYQGQELGMENVVFDSIDEINDISTHDQYKLALEHGLDKDKALKAVTRCSRDNARTPMQWTSEENAGFTTGEPWLKVNSNYERINAEDQMRRQDSVFSFYKELIRLRKDERYKDCIVYGKQIPVLEDVDNLMAFYRQSDEKTLFVIANYQKDAREIDIPDIEGKTIISNYGIVEKIGTKLCLQGYQFVVMEVKA